MDLPVLDVSYKWDHTVCGLWSYWLPSLTITFSRLTHVVAGITVAGARSVCSFIHGWTYGLFPLWGYKPFYFYLAFEPFTQMGLCGHQDLEQNKTKSALTVIRVGTLPWGTLEGPTACGKQFENHCASSTLPLLCPLLPATVSSGEPQLIQETCVRPSGTIRFS